MTDPEGEMLAVGNLFRRRRSRKDVLLVVGEPFLSNYGAHDETEWIYVIDMNHGERDAIQTLTLLSFYELFL